ncbi:MAG: hypothetical protein AAGG68_27070 [Bacteroidota bacterium]
MTIQKPSIEETENSDTDSATQRSWNFLYEFEGKTILDLYGEVPEFRKTIEERLGKNTELITEVEASGSEIKKEGNYLIISGTIRHGFFDESPVFYSAELIIDVEDRKFYALNYQSDTNKFSYFFEEREVLPPPVIKSLERFYLRPSSKPTDDWGIMDYYQLFAYSLTHPIKFDEESEQYKLTYESPTKSVIYIYNNEDIFLDFSLKGKSEAFKQSIQIGLYARKNKTPLIGLSESNSDPRWKGDKHQLKFYELSKQKRLVEVTDKILNAQKIMNILLPAYPSKKYEGQHQYGLYYMMGELSPMNEYSFIKLNFNNLQLLCKGEAPEELELYYDEDYTWNDKDLACSLDFKKWNEKEIYLFWNIEEGKFKLRDNLTGDPFVAGLEQPYLGTLLPNLAHLNKELLLEAPPTYLVEDEYWEQYRIAIKQDDGWFCWRPNEYFPLDKIQIDSIYYFDFDEQGTDELIFYYTEEEILENGATRQNSFLHIWKLDTLTPYFKSSIACKEFLESKNPQVLSYRTEASIQASIAPLILTLDNYDSIMTGTQNEEGEFIAVDEMSGDFYILKPCSTTQLEGLQGQYRMVDNTLRKQEN